jgi:hypothetical protein
MHYKKTHLCTYLFGFPEPVSLDDHIDNANVTPTGSHVKRGPSALKLGNKMILDRQKKKKEL